jgi:hypothetical protein
MSDETKHGRLGSAPRPKPVHYANLLREDGAASALCFAKPHPIDLRRASWTNRRGAATCRKCRAMLEVDLATKEEQ